MSERRLMVACAAAMVLAAGHVALARAGDLGAGRPLGPEALRAEMVRNDILAEYVTRHGQPDWVELQRVTADAPLVPYEIRVFYLDEGVSASFTQARLVGGLEVSIKRWEHPLSESKRAVIFRELLALDPTRRAEAAADRAEAAAERVEAAADAAEAAAETATSVVAEMEGQSSGARSWH